MNNVFFGEWITFLFSISALVHDLAESIVGDITPYCGVSKEEKRKRELDAMQEIAKLIAPRGGRLMELFEVLESNIFWIYSYILDFLF